MRRFVYVILIGISCLLMWGANAPHKEAVVFLQGQGPLYDSVWVQTLLGRRAHGTLSEIYQVLAETRSFEKIRIHPTPSGDYQVRVVSRKPLFRIVLPLRSLYVDSTGEFFPALRPLNVPLIAMPRLDTTAVEALREAFIRYPFLRLLVSHVMQDTRQVFWGYSQIGQETFCLGRNEELLEALPKMISFYRHWRSYMGSCRRVHLNLKNQVICQKS
ncbi:MAG: hypothetical protein ACUVRD_02935 [Bacteroidia bacterium]